MSRDPKRFWIVGNKIYTICGDCESLVQINKRFFGSIHICLTDEEIEQKRGVVQQGWIKLSKDDKKIEDSGKL